LADAWQHLRKEEESTVFGFVANNTPLGVVAILLSSFVVAPSRLQMTVGVRAYPDIRPGLGNYQQCNTPKSFGVTKASPVNTLIPKFFAFLLTQDTWMYVCAIPQPPPVPR
jgi:hypothetical protein